MWLGHSCAHAGTGTKTGHAEAELLSEQQQITADLPFWLALQLTPETGWHTYWKNPGDAGKATTVKWNLPRGWTASPLYWPYPERIRTGPLVSFGYTDRVILLTEIKATTVPPATSRIEISAMADWLVCEEVCIPENAVLKLSLPLGPKAIPDPETVSAFKSTRALLPRNVSWTARYAYSGNKLLFDVPLQLSTMPATGLESMLFFPVEDNLIENSSSQSFLLGENKLRVSVNMGYLQQGGSFHGVLVLKESSGKVESIEFTADPVKRLPALITQ